MSGSKNSIPTIVFDGGPCAGKSTILAILLEWLIGCGFTPLIVPETATTLITSGFRPNDPALSPRAFQESIMRYQVSAENHLRRMAELFPAERKPVLLLDRGLLSCKAYTRPEDYPAILAELGWTEGSLFARYSTVVFLRTAALGAEEFYTLSNNTARREGTLEEARDVDERTLQCWVGHPHLTVVPNLPGKTFRDKENRVKQIVAKALGIPVPLEIERKFLVDRQRLAALPVPFVRLEIEQAYLRAEDGTESRVRATERDGFRAYTRTTKKRIRPGVRVEEERVISENEYRSLLRTQIPGTERIVKDRLTFIWENQHFELDLFLGSKSGMAFLEAELTDIDDALTLPPFVPIIREVTDDRSYTNARLAGVP